MRVLLGLVVAACLIVLANGHAKLVSPIAFNPNPSKSAPCGGGATLASAAANWPPNSQQTISWTQVASDGGGQLKMYIDPKGTQGNFPTNVGDTPSATLVAVNFPYSTNANQNYQFNITVPDVDCNGPTGLCSVVIFTATSWWACTLVNIRTSNVEKPAVVANTTISTCVTASGLSFCDMVNGQSVSIPFGQTLAQLDESAKISYNTTLENPRVFSTPTKAGCLSSYKYLMCATIFKSCNYLGINCDYYQGYAGCFCVTTCTQASKLCSLNVTHTDLLGCATSSNAQRDATTNACSSLVNYFGASSDNETATRSTLPPGGSAASVSISVFAVFVVALAALF
jgi:hypothetical protein